MSGQRKSFNQHTEVDTLNGLAGTITLTSTGNTVTITPNAANKTINLEAPGSGGGGSPGGDPGQIQYNIDGTTFGGFGSWDGETLSFPNLDVEGITGSVEPPNTPSVSYDYASIFPPANVVATLTTGSYTYYLPDYPVTSPDFNFTIYSYVDIGDPTTYSSTSVTFNFPSPAPDPGTSQVYGVETVADVSGSLNSTYFLLYDPSGNSYYTWYSVDGGGSDPSAGNFGILVDISTDDDANTVASKTTDAINAYAYFTANNPHDNVIEVTEIVSGPASDGDPGSSGFTVYTITPGVAPNDFITFGVDVHWDDVTGGTAYAAIVATSDALGIFDTYRYDVAVSNITLNGGSGDTDLQGAPFPDFRPIANGVLENYYLYSQKAVFNETFYSDTFTTVPVQDNGSGYQINSEIIDYIPGPGSTGQVVQRESDLLFAYSPGTEFQIIGANFSSLDISNNSFFINNIIINSTTLQINGPAQSTKIWGDLQVDQFHGVGAQSIGVGSFAWGNGGIASGTNAILFSTAGISAGDYGFVAGIQSQNYGIYGIAMGDNAYNYANGGICMGGSSMIDQFAGRGVSIGPYCSMYGVEGENGSVQFGIGCTVTGVANALVGTSSSINGNNSGALGALVGITGNTSYGMGFNFGITGDGIIGFGISARWMTMEGGDVRVEVGDHEIMDYNRGVVLHSPDDTRWRISVSDLGIITASSI